MNKEQAILIVNSLADELNICFHWINEFNILFPKENLQYELYEEIAPNFFHYLSRFYYDYFFLKISKMLDPAEVSGFDNLSLYQLVNIAINISPDNVKIIKKDIDKIKEDARIILNARKKIIAHSDLDVVITKENLGETKFVEIESIISNMSKVINKVLRFLGESSYSFGWLYDLYGAKSLIQALKNSSYYRDLQIKLRLFDEIRKIEHENKFYML